MSELNVNIDDIEDAFPVAPPGLYSLIIDKCDYAVEKDDPSTRKTDKNGDEYLQVSFKVQDGEFAGVTLFVNYLHPKKSSFKELCNAAGKFGHVNDTAEFLGLTLRAKVGVETYNGKEKNVIQGYVV